MSRRIRALALAFLAAPSQGCDGDSDRLGCLDCGCGSRLDLAVMDGTGVPVQILGGVVVVGDERCDVDCSGDARQTNYACEQTLLRLDLGATTGVDTEVEAELYGESWTLVMVDPQLPTWDPQCDGGRDGCPPACVWGELEIRSGVAPGSR